MFITWSIVYIETTKYCYCYIDVLYLSNQEKIRAKFAKVKSHLRSRKCKKLPQRYRKLADLRLRTTRCYVAEFSVSEQNANLRFSALVRKDKSKALLLVKERICRLKRERDIKFIFAQTLIKLQ